jgi:hypothetical protein
VPAAKPQCQRLPPHNCRLVVVVQQQSDGGPQSYHCNVVGGFRRIMMLSEVFNVIRTAHASWAQYGSPKLSVWA